MYAYEIAYREALIAKGITMEEDHERLRQIYEYGKACRELDIPQA